MKNILSNRNVFIISIIAGMVFWAVFAWFDIEPWDSPHGWAAVGILGFVLGFIGNGKPWLWPLGIYLGEAIFGVGSFLTSLFFYRGGGANMFIPLGVLFLILFTLPAFIGSMAGFGIKKATRSLSRATQKPRE